MKKIKVKTSCGIVHGIQEKNYCIFQGIPYATTERFEKPTQITKWEKEIDATKRGPDCPQYASFRKETPNFYYKEFRENDGEAFFQEGVVNLNIVAPSACITLEYEDVNKDLQERIKPSSKEKCPVLIYIHGGGHETGTVSEMPGGISMEYVKHGIVYVAIGYRLNVFSLFHSLNLGLFDQLTAIKWLQAHIASFGGDAENMTLIGQSAGAMSIMDLCYSDKLTGRIKGVIALSGGGMIPACVGPLSPKEMWPFWDRVMKKAGAVSIEELKKLDAEILWNAWYETSRNPYKLRYVQPGVDGEIIQDIPQRLIKQKKQLDVPYLLGVTSQDFMPIFAYEMALTWGIHQASIGAKPVYGGFFDHTLPGDSYKAFHGADLWYVFGNREKSWRPFTEMDDMLADRMVAYIANFVKKGNPNGNNLPEWSPIDRKQKNFRCFGAEKQTMISPFQCRKKMWHTFLWERGPM